MLPTGWQCQRSRECRTALNFAGLYLGRRCDFFSHGLRCILSVRPCVHWFPTAFHDSCLNRVGPTGMVRSVMQYLHTTTGITVIQVNVTLPAKSYMAYVNPLQAALSQYGPRVRCVIFSHISSVPAIIEPVKELAGKLLPHSICFLSVSLSIFIKSHLAWSMWGQS